MLLGRVLEDKNSKWNAYQKIQAPGTGCWNSVVKWGAARKKWLTWEMARGRLEWDENEPLKKKSPFNRFAEPGNYWDTKQKEVYEHRWFSVMSEKRLKVQKELDWQILGPIQQTCQQFNGKKYSGGFFLKKTETWVSDRWYLAQQYYMWEGSGCSGRPQIKHKLAGCSAAKRINEIVSCQQRNSMGTDSSSLYSAGLTTPGILCLVLVTAIEEGCELEKLMNAKKREGALKAKKNC